MTSPEETFEAWNHRLWQTHPARRRGTTPHYWFPTHEDFRRRWPRLARELIVADWRIEGALAGVDGEAEVERFDPPAAEPDDWRRLYAGELATHPGLYLALSSENPVAAVARRAKLTPAELDAFRLWSTGASVGTIARAFGRKRGTIDKLLERARFRLFCLRPAPSK